ncbi:MAG TPA: hypothetical protein PL143_12035, partial [Rhodocyclaceae bacterium]|nr:hypothetical protein [Rhodocyclaceae bacterium]
MAENVVCPRFYRFYRFYRVVQRLGHGVLIHARQIVPLDRLFRGVIQRGEHDAPLDPFEQRIQRRGVGARSGFPGGGDLLAGNA